MNYSSVVLKCLSHLSSLISLCNFFFELTTSVFLLLSFSSQRAPGDLKEHLELSMINNLFSRSFSLGTEESVSYILFEGLMAVQNLSASNRIVLGTSSPPLSSQATCRQKWSKANYSRVCMCVCRVVHMCVGHVATTLADYLLKNFL